MRIGIKRDIERYRLIGGYGGKEGKREEKRYQGKGGAATKRQPSGNQTATKNSWSDIKGPYRSPCYRCKFPWKWYDFLPIPGSAKLQKRKPRSNPRLFYLLIFSLDFFGASGIIIISVARGAIVCRPYPAKGVELKEILTYVQSHWRAAWSYDCAAFLGPYS